MRISHRLIKYLKFKNVLIDFNIRLENANESVSEPGEKSAEINQSEEWIEKRDLKKINQCFNNLSSGTATINLAYM